MVRTARDPIPSAESGGYPQRASRARSGGRLKLIGGRSDSGVSATRRRDAGQAAHCGGGNTALKEMVQRVTVDYTRGELRMAWRHDGETEITYLSLMFDRSSSRDRYVPESLFVVRRSGQWNFRRRCHHRHRHRHRRPTRPRLAACLRPPILSLGDVAGRIRS